MIGDELLIGQIQDTNSTWLMQLLTSEGFIVAESRRIRDDKATIIRTLEELSKISGIIIMTGGLGPTKDDCTKEAFAKFAGVKLTHNERQWQHILHRFERREHLLSVLHKSQALMPENTELLNNPVGTALGITYKNENNAFIMLPGVPPEMKAIILDGGGLKWLKGFQSDFDIIRKTFVTIGKSETWLADRIRDFDEHLPPSLGIAYLPSASHVKIRLTYRHSQGMEVMTAERFTYFAERLKTELGESVYAEEDITIEEKVGQILREGKKQLGTAESCTGGYLAHLLTKEAGASDFFKGSVIAYHNKVKENTLKVKPADLEKYGAVSEEVVRQMAVNLCNVLDCDYSIAISGIAGPGGGTAEKPVGTVWIAVADKEGNFRTELLKLGTDRQLNIKRATSLSLNLLRNFLLA